MPSSERRLPSVLIVGAMKCGTTGICRDLDQNDAVFLPAVKEPACLIKDWVETPKGRAWYESFYARARAEQVLCDGSTAYASLPGRTGIPERALRMLGPDLRIIYSVRNPIARIRSHHHHNVGEDARNNSYADCDPDINAAVRDQPWFINWSRYAMQLEAWLEVFGADRVRVVRFERYIEDRASTIAALSRFIGVEPQADRVDPERVHHRTEGKPVVTGPWQLLRRNRLYHSLVGWWLPYSAKERIRSVVLPKAPPRPDAPSDETKAYIKERLAADQHRLAELLSDAPDNAAVVRPKWDGGGALGSV